MTASSETKTMKAAVYRQYGPPSVVRVEEMPKPVAKADEILIQVKAAPLSSADWRMRTLSMPKGFGPFARPVFGFFGPRRKILGSELSGVVEAIGKDVSNFQVGDEVFAFPDIAVGSHAEYRCMKASGLVVKKPMNLSFEEASGMCFGGATALHYLRKMAELKPGERVLVVGASGAVGSAAVQVAKAMGAHVTGVCSSNNLAQVRVLGADDAIDYTSMPYPFPKTFDVIFESVGSVDYQTCKPMLNENGRMLLIVATLPEILSAGRVTRGTSHKVIAGPSKTNLAMLGQLAEWAEQSRYRPLVDRTYSLNEIQEAHAYVEAGRKRGNVVIRMTH